ncbi:MAG TPA: hypothetical protein VF378_09080 [Geothrix sp.]
MSRSLMLLTLVGCISSAGLPAFAQAAPAAVDGPKVSSPQAPAGHVLVLATTYKALFPKVIELLLDHDYIILMANQDLGLISFRLQAEDKAIRSSRHVNVVEGTLLLQEASPTSPSSTRVRVKLTLSWQNSNFQIQHETGAQMDADPGYYQGFLKMFETAGLSTK